MRKCIWCGYEKTPDGCTNETCPEYAGQSPSSPGQSESEDDAYVIIHGKTLALLTDGADITDPD